MTEIVISNCYGGFSINEKVIKRMIELGSKKAEDLYKTKYYKYSYLTQANRYDPYLVQAVKDLGTDAGPLVIEVIDGDKFIINEYDGLESIETPDSINWHIIKK